MTALALCVAVLGVALIARDVVLRLAAARARAADYAEATAAIDGVRANLQVLGARTDERLAALELAEQRRKQNEMARGVRS